MVDSAIPLLSHRVLPSRVLHTDVEIRRRMSFSSGMLSSVPTEP